MSSRPHDLLCGAPMHPEGVLADPVEGSWIKPTKEIHISPLSKTESHGKRLLIQLWDESAFAN